MADAKTETTTEPQTTTSEVPTTVPPMDDIEDGKEHKGNRGEKKMRKAMQKMGLKSFPGVIRVAVRKGASIFTVSSPDVYKTPEGETYVVFGEIKIEDPNTKLKESAAEKFVAPSAPSMMTSEPIPEAEDETDAEGLDEKDIELVMSNGNCSRAKAISALKKSNKDIVNAILEVSSN